MCGFAGVIAWDDRYRFTRDTLARMSLAIAHRGPDGEGVYLNHEDEVKPGRPQVGLVHRRLAILDPDPRSNQPFTDGRHWLVFNGEIYNYRELRAELKTLLPNYAWRTEGDTEVLLASYAAWGEKCVEHFNGMFAIAIWDDVEKSLFLARDRMGQKPLYVARTPGAIAFASELSALITLPWIDRTVSTTSLVDYLRFGAVPGATGATIYAACSQLKPASFDVFTRAGLVRSETYFDPSAPHSVGETFSKRTSGQVRERVRAAVTRQLVSDVPLGVFLSGGIDSSIIAACARERGPTQTFSIGFGDARYDESDFARQVAGHLGTKHHTFTVTPRATAYLEQLAAVFGEPFGDSSALPTHYIARETRQHVKVALSGDGGDELFGGYDRYRALDLDRFIRRVPRALRGMFAGRVLEQLPSSHPKSVASRTKRFLQSITLDAGERYSSYLRIFQEDHLTELLLPGAAPDTPHPDRIARQMDQEMTSPDVTSVQAALRVDRRNYLPDDLLTKVDRASMLHALEVRSPFMDHELVQFAAGLTTDQLLKGGPKRMLREAFAGDLPDFVFKRKKMGFAVPIGEWFRTDANLKAMLVDHLFATDSFARSHFAMPVVQRLVDQHMSERVDHSQRLYALLMLELWWKTARRGA